MIGNGDYLVRFGPFSVDLHTHELLKDSTKLRLVGQPFEILAMLLGRPGELVTRDELRDRLWAGDTFVDFDHGLNAAVNKLREALCDSAENPRYVETLPRRGYRFIGKVERPALDQAIPGAFLELADSASASLNNVRREIGPDQVQNGAVESAELRARRRNLIGAAATIALLLGGTLLLKTMPSRGKQAEGRLQSPQIHPFTAAAETSGEPAFSADGNYIAFYREDSKSQDSGIFVQQIGSDKPRQLTKSEKDCCPVWSPDGRLIAFTRDANSGLGIYVVPSNGGTESRLEVHGAKLKIRPLAWSPDGKTIAFSGDAGLFLLSLENFAAHRLTTAPPLTQDWGPSFSSDGKLMLFARSSELGLPEDLMTVPATGGDPTLITTEAARLRGPSQWSPDGRSVIFASDRGGKSALWRVSVETRESAVQLNEGGSYPAVAPNGNRLAYQRETRSLTIWQMDLSAKGKSESRVLVPLTSQTDQGPGPQFSPDGKKLAYMSDRSGTMEIWVSDRDGGNSFQLSAGGNAGTPRWSPDSQAIVFDANRRKGAGIYVLGLRGGEPRLLTQDEFDNRCPSWSEDGKSVYFASARNGAWQVWKVRAEGGTPVQLTKRGGHAALESADGRSVYYAKTPYANPEIWQVPVNGGPESLLSARVRPASWASWSVVAQGILFAQSSGKGPPVVNLYDVTTHRMKTVGTLDIVPFWLAATRDGKTVAFDKPGWQQAQIMLIENFR